MTMIQIALIATLLLISVILAVLLIVLIEIRQDQINFNRIFFKSILSLIGNNSDGTLHEMKDDLKIISNFINSARKGRIPNLRYDDWYATSEDVKRWERAADMDAYSR